MVCGWLSPEGKYYPCLSYEHETSAEDITLEVYHDPAGSVLLENEGWLRIMKSGRIYYTKTPKEAQAIALEGMLHMTSTTQQVQYMLAVGKIIDEVLHARK